MSAGCPRSFEAEALRDGRLTGSAKASFERHLGVCAACTGEARALEALAQALRAAPAPGTVADELHARRERTRLLAAFDRAVVRPEPRFRPRSALLAAAGVVMAVMMAWLFGAGAWFPREAPESELRAARDAAVVVTADGTATWSRRSEGARETVVLSQGALSIRVDSRESGVRLLVVLPDGELEDIGTTFHVRVEGGRTERVRVDEGRVVLRLRGRPPLVLEAGQGWTPDDAPSVVPPPAPSLVPQPAPSAPRGEPSSVSAIPSATAMVPTQAPAAAAAPATVRSPNARSAAPEPAPSAAELPAARPESDASADFRAAMTAFDRGDAGTAAALFARFASAHPTDARAEDAAYLRILALQRAGRASAMKQAALDYLRRYPKGFRRAEAEALSR